jgi:hypothetical protein
LLLTARQRSKPLGAITVWKQPMFVPQELPPPFPYSPFFFYNTTGRDRMSYTMIGHRAVWDA